ncbi:ribosomal protein S18-alanine N-acetyltransferase [Kingella kingae]|uniref:[Ribosomal protein bS18]-alanine N-acetyltransferase n=2 Tax=Kingella kingae TaxID=504 RepID=F5S852_KINKI|nr:ribosomal protein S18-alanine N-acetyltransferase [Kingella kingae]EGK08373.1 ribosomal-protein-alanine acetyltransferase [Kingella kingae ATCC 23330]MDK4534152.1 ribosomal protein S18-alanine N-acetyltransferase [Kingella kingae]MDK4540651.1 ribosomal protein S18-alanine N-acetyltransferase [Kingella kingae]MDK4553250.1 ribosomal protein S18-alanine N-acetyltransferase [Kingella kingae]UOP02677.1 ribosomal protein S18-alanine N-acetyltransferase [Kingella kingae]
MKTNRLAQPNDLADLQRIDTQSNPSAWTAAHFEAACTSPHDTVLVLQQQQHIVAFIVWQTVCDEMELHLIATDTAYRQQGCASALIEHMLHVAHQQNIARIFLEVRQSNHAAQQLYAKHGFVHIATRKNYYSNGENAWIMERLC